MSAVPTRAERRARTRAELIDAAERLFARQGFHTTSVDAVAAEAGFTKGAVYSNFASKEELFLAVYERRLDRRVAEFEAMLATAPTAVDGVREMARSAGGRDEGWLAVFFEFWAHVLRHRELLERFARLHARVVAPLEAALVRAAEERGEPLREDPRKLATAGYAMQLGLQLERLTQPGVVDPDLAVRMAALPLAGGGDDGLSDHAPAGLHQGRAREPDAAGA